MTEQRIPDVDFNDVDRVLKRDFSPEERQLLRNLIAASEFRVEARVILACLKLADGDMSRAQEAINEAAIDWRDVIAIAEYPSYCRQVSRTDELSELELQKIYQQDWEQYSTWLQADKSPTQESRE